MKYLITIVTLIFFTSCSNQASDNKNTQTEVHVAQSTKVTLVGGEKWKVNFATTKGINNMISLIEGINSKSSLSDYQKLGADMKTEFQHIFQRCDMTGEAHNQLHNYLQPMPPLFKDLTEGDLKNCQLAVKKIENHLEEFNTYFK